MGNQPISRVKESAHSGEGEGLEPKEFTINFSPELLQRLVGTKKKPEVDSGTENQQSHGEASIKSKGVLQSAEIAREKAIEIQTSEEILNKVDSIISSTTTTIEKAKDHVNGSSVFESCSGARKTYLDCLKLNLDPSACGDAMKAYSSCVSESPSK